MVSVTVHGGNSLFADCFGNFTQSLVLSFLFLFVGLISGLCQTLSFSSVMSKKRVCALFFFRAYRRGKLAKKTTQRRLDQHSHDSFFFIFLLPRTTRQEKEISVLRFCAYRAR